MSLGTSIMNDSVGFYLRISYWYKYRATVCSCHATYAFQSESTLCSCLNVKELFSRSRSEIWSLSDCYWTRTQNHLVRKGILNHLGLIERLIYSSNKHNLHLKNILSSNNKSKQRSTFKFRQESMISCLCKYNTLYKLLFSHL